MERYSRETVLRKAGISRDVREIMQRLYRDLEETDMEPYKARLITEYKELKARHDKLARYINRITAVIQYDAKVDAPHDCPLDLLELQRNTMHKYLDILEIRAAIEDVDLDKQVYVEDKDQEESHE